LTGEFMFKLKMVVWAAAFAGLIPYYDDPVASDGEVLTADEEALAKEVAEQSVMDLIFTAKRDGACESRGGSGGGGGTAQYLVCTGVIAMISG